MASSDIDLAFKQLDIILGTNEEYNEKQEIENIRNNSYLSKCGYVILKEALYNNKTWSLSKLQNDLVGRPLQKNESLYTKNTFPIYIQTKTKVYIPKCFGIKHFGMPKDTHPNFFGETELYTFKGELYPEQTSFMKRVLNVDSGLSTVLCMPTGSGKTTLSLKLISVLNKKTLIIVNKIALMNQWIKEIETFLGIKREDITIIQGQKVSLDSKKIGIAMLHSLAKIDYPLEYFKMYGTVIFDEVHNIPCAIFSKVFFKLCSFNTIGLSATPKRSDGCEYIFTWHIGDTLTTEGTAGTAGQGTAGHTLEPIIRYYQLSSNDYESFVNEKTKKLEFSKMLSSLIMMKARNVWIVDTIFEVMKTQGRRILLLSERREHIVALLELIASRYPVWSYAPFVGGMKDIVLEKNKKADVILATFQAFGEGISEKDLNTLMLTTPKKYIGHLERLGKTNIQESGKLKQIIGRIFRKAHMDLAPLIIDLHDQYSVYTAHANSRKVFYKEHFPKATFETHKVTIK